MDRYKWLIEAAGDSDQRLAELSLLLAGAAMATAQSLPRKDGLPVLLEMRAAIHEISVRMGLEKEMSQAIKDVWGTSGQG